MSIADKLRDVESAWKECAVSVDPPGQFARLGRAIDALDSEGQVSYTEEIRATMLAALRQYRGDDLERAKAAFRGCSPEQMQEVWSGNGETRQEVLDEYQNHVDIVDAAVAAILGEEKVVPAKDG